MTGGSPMSAPRASSSGGASIQRSAGIVRSRWGSSGRSSVWWSTSTSGRSAGTVIPRSSQIISTPMPTVGIVMGSATDLDVMRPAAEALDEFGISREVRVISAHRAPADAARYAEEAAGRGLQVTIAGAGGAAHLPGVLAASTSLPVIGVPVPIKVLDGLDSLLSIVRMPAGIPVATVSIGGARNAGLLAVRLLAASDPALREQMDAFRATLTEKNREADAKAQAEFG